MTVVRQLCHEYVFLHRIDCTIYQKLSILQHKLLAISWNHSIRLPTNLTKPHHLSVSHQGPSIPLPLSHRRSIENHSITKASGRMNTTSEERNSKRSREPDSTMSPPPKKVHHKISSGGAGNSVEELVSSVATSSFIDIKQENPDTTESGELPWSGVSVSEGETVQQRLTSDKTMIDTIKSEEAILEEKFAGEVETTDTILMYEGDTLMELTCLNMTDRKLLLQGTTDDKLTIEHRDIMEEPNDLQVKMEPQITTSDTAVEATSRASSGSHSTAVSDSRPPCLAQSSIKGEEAEKAKEMSNSEVEAREPHKKKKKKSSSHHNKNQTFSGRKQNVRPNYFVGVQISNPEESENNAVPEERDTRCEGNNASLQPSRPTGSVLPTPPKKRKSAYNKADHVLDLVAKRMEAPQNSECDLFGTYVAKRLESLKKANPTMYPLLKKLINDAIFEAEMGTLTPYSRIVQNQAPSLSSTPVPFPSPTFHQAPSLSSTPVPSPMPTFHQDPHLSINPGEPIPSPSVGYNYHTFPNSQM